jgi:hypothetical protein
MQVGATAHEKSELQSLIFQGENPRCDLKLLCLTMALLKTLFERNDFLQDENLRSMIGQRQRLCIVFFLEASLLEKLNFWCYLCGVSTVILRNRSL